MNKTLKSKKSPLTCVKCFFFFFVFKGNLVTILYNKNLKIPINPNQFYNDKWVLREKKPLYPKMKLSEFALSETIISL